MAAQSRRSNNTQAARRHPDRAERERVSVRRARGHGALPIVRHRCDPRPPAPIANCNVNRQARTRSLTCARVRIAETRSTSR